MALIPSDPKRLPNYFMTIFKTTKFKAGAVFYSQVMLAVG
jgi:hypothetical protein